ncbi:MAG: FAD-dependent oxidoreductase [Lachnospiraceae bacterium]|nr:FAD-dependent oxidoreductase [Lachnospiraceae bacterium]
MLNDWDFRPETYTVEDPEKLELLKKLGAMISDRRDIKGWESIETTDYEVWALNKLLTKEEVKFMLSFKKRRVKVYTAEQLAKMNNMSTEAAQAMCDRLCGIGILEFNRENADHHIQYLVPRFVVGSGEYMMMNHRLLEEVPEVATLFTMAAQAVGPVAHLVAPGGSGIGMHVIPVEEAIPAESKSVPLEHLTHWLKKYDKYALGICSCRRQQRMRGEGDGFTEGEFCITVGDMAEYMVETGKDARYISYEECLEVLHHAEERGFVHQITNLDGENKIVGICNCAPGVCNALRTSLLYNTPNMSSSAYRAHVDREKCVACGKCVEVCPAGAAKLGQKLCRKNGQEVEYPKAVLPDLIPWGPENWDFCYRDNIRINCYDTGTSPCKTACPTHLSVQGYVELAAEGRYLDALKLIKQDNPFPAICGAVCNRRCEDRCTRGTLDQPVAIDEIKKFIAAQELYAENRYIPKCENDEGRLWGDEYKIAVIGSGPAGLSAAFYLRSNGYSVTVFEKEAKPGGMMMNAIPSFRLEKDVVRAEIDVLRQMGVEFCCNVEVGKNISIPELRKQGYKGFYLAIGLQNGGKMGIPGEDAAGVEPGISFVKRVNLSSGVQLDGKVVVIGGGSIGADVARTALRCGAQSVDLYCLEAFEEMPMGEEDTAACTEEGISLHPGWGQTEIVTENGKCRAVKFRRCLSVKDENGRFSPRFDDSVTDIAEADYVLYCIGQKPEWGNLLAGTEVKLNKRGLVIADEVTYQADTDIFVGGDIYTGQKFCIDAIAAGKQGAVSLHRNVHEGHSLTLSRDLRRFIELDRDDIQVLSYDNANRQIPGRNAAAEKTFADPRQTLTEKQVRIEAKRCLHCGATTVDVNKCIGCGLCTTRCQFDAIHLQRDMPQNTKMYTGEEGLLKSILPYALKRQIKIKFKGKK